MRSLPPNPSKLRNYIWKNLSHVGIFTSLKVVLQRKKWIFLCLNIKETEFLGVVANQI